MDREEMLSLFQQHRKAEAARDYDAIMATFVEDCYLETVPLCALRVAPQLERLTRDTSLPFPICLLTTRASRSAMTWRPQSFLKTLWPSPGR